ncbi:hypothetical protein [Polaromonas sp. A23]|uniref:hypothetical protein n=1 Tax=Polaromonas sp. A23 TaxID=1944133 RepID=UPI000986E25A|nr:hypothetical protein [Polaromonas sp. A23]OOG48444.1 hypothetical protein B0B52_00440 [Polaromonas sp. A23]
MAPMVSGTLAAQFDIFERPLFGFLVWQLGVCAAEGVEAKSGPGEHSFLPGLQRHSRSYGAKSR